MVYGRTIRKNSDNFIIENMYRNMTPQEYKEGIEKAVEMTKKELSYKFEKKLEKINNEYNDSIHYNMSLAIQTISTELLYELANQMNYWDLEEETEEDKYIKESAKYRIQEIYNNTIDAIKKYADMKLKSSPRKEYEKKKEK